MKKSKVIKNVTSTASLVPLLEQVAVSESETVFSHMGNETAMVLSTNNQSIIKLMGNRQPDEVMHGQMVGYKFTMTQTKWKKMLRLLAPDVTVVEKKKRQGRELSPEHLAKLQAGRAKAKVKA
jgi:hypothetical protein